MEFKQEPFERVYELCDELGSGQYAVVNLCRRRSTAEKFAAKCIHKSGALSASNGVDMAAIRNEVSVLRALDHDHIVRLVEVFESRLAVTIVLEYVEGGELFAFLAEKDRLDEEEASGFVLQLLTGVAHIHEKRIVHLDLKPENIMLEHCTGRRHEPRIKLIDFGLARRCEAGCTISVQPHGTPEFISPEVLACDPVCASADMWTVGVIIYVMLFGSGPFTASTDAAIFRRILAAQYSFENTISDMAKDLIRSLLQRAPAKRLTAAQALRHVWVTPQDEEYAKQRKRSVITRENLQKLKRYVGAKQRWKKTVELITVCNHFSQMASYKRSNSYNELSQYAVKQTPSGQLPQIMLTGAKDAANASAGAPAACEKSGTSRQLKPVNAASRTLSGAGLGSSASANANANPTLTNLRSLLKPVSKSNKYN